MLSARKTEALFLFFGDVVFFLLALWLTLGIRYATLPSFDIFYNHLVPFSFLFLIWILVFFIAGLYDQHTVFFKSRLPRIILGAQVANVVIAALFFFVVPTFGIAPKTNLAIYLFVSFSLIVLWRLYLVPLIGARERRGALLVAGGDEAKELAEEVNNNRRYSFQFIDIIDAEKVNAGGLSDRIFAALRNPSISLAVLNTTHQKLVDILPHLYKPLFSNVQFVDFSELYEDIFDRVPISSVARSSYFTPSALRSSVAYTLVHRLTDIVGGLLLFLMSLIFYPLVFVAIKLDDGGPIFLVQRRVGKDNQIIKTIKFRSMSVAEGGGKEHITRVGNILRKTRIDESPQLLNVLGGSLSLIGPRPELPELVSVYEKQIPFYNLRHSIKPGMSGWAQIHHENHPHYHANVFETAVKLSYDLYYLKHRSLWLDVKILLRTIQLVLSRSGA